MRAPHPPPVILTAVSAFQCRASAHLLQRPGAGTMSLANLRWVIDPSASQTGLAVRSCHATNPNRFRFGPSANVAPLEEVAPEPRFRHSDFFFGPSSFTSHTMNIT